MSIARSMNGFRLFTCKEQARAHPWKWVGFFARSPLILPILLRRFPMLFQDLRLPSVAYGCLDSLHQHLEHPIVPEIVMKSDGVLHPQPCAANLDIGCGNPILTLWMAYRYACSSR